VNACRLAQLEEVQALLSQFNSGQNSNSVAGKNAAPVEGHGNNPTVNWPPMAYDFNWVVVPKVSVYADQSGVIGDGNCLLYAFVEGFTNPFPNRFNELPRLAPLFRQKADLIHRWGIKFLHRHILQIIFR
jgi:hypothetical protein